MGVRKTEREDKDEEEEEEEKKKKKKKEKKKKKRMIQDKLCLYDIKRRQEEPNVKSFDQKQPKGKQISRLENSAQSTRVNTQKILWYC